MSCATHRHGRRLLQELLQSALVVCLAGCLVSVGSSSSALDEKPLPTPAALEKASPSMKVDFSGGLLSVKAKDADIRAIVETISTKSGVEIVLDKTITGKVTVEFPGMKFEEGLKKILGEVVEGGFISEYVKKDSAANQFSLHRVAVTRQGTLPASARVAADENALKIGEMYVGLSKGKEVMFAKWGEGNGQIPIKTVSVKGAEVRQGFARFRVGEDGTFYLVSWGHGKVWVYDKTGAFKGSLDIHGMRGNSFDIDHEGNIYLMVNYQKKDQDFSMEILVYDGNLKQIAHTWAPYVPGNCNSINDGILYDYCSPGKATYDFRYLLKNPDRQSKQLKFNSGPSVSKVGADPLDSERGGVAMLRIAGGKGKGLESETVLAPYPLEWEAKGPSSDMGFLSRQGENVYLMMGIGSGKRFYDDYGIAILNLADRVASYYRCAEKDSFVYENGNLREEYRRFDVDIEGNVYHLITTKDGVHIYKHALESRP